MSARGRWILPLISLLGTGVQVGGQTVAGRAVIAAPKSSVRLGGVTERIDGAWAGLTLELTAGAFSLAGIGTRGRLTAPDVPRRDVGEMSVAGRYDLRPWLSVDAGYIARAFSSAAGYQRWGIVAVGASGHRDLGTPAVRAVVTLAWLPVVKITNQEAPTFALRSDVGLFVTPGRFPLDFALAYRVERFHFSAAAARSEQFEAFTLSVGVQARRRAGGWTLNRS